jgi:hypothetical protein
MYEPLRVTCTLSCMYTQMYIITYVYTDVHIRIYVRTRSVFRLGQSLWPTGNTRAQARNAP